MKIKSFAVALCISLALMLSVSACSSEPNEDPSDRKNSKSSRATSSTNSTSSNFQRDVQSVCNSVEPEVFDAIIGIDPAKDPGYKEKFDEAESSLDSLYQGFSNAIVPDINKQEWEKGLESLSQLKIKVAKVSEQYSEYVALTEESKTNQDLARTAEIIQRLLELGGEYLTTVQEIQTLFQEVLLVGASAGVPKCHAFELSQKS